MCRICREDVVPTVTMYPPGLPMQLQKPVIEYKNEDEYGRLMKPCLCKGSARYIHELCLTRSRTEVARSSAMWQCPTCGYKFNFTKLKFTKLLKNKLSVTVFTALFMMLVIFVLGFIADPIINLYLDPYDTIRGREPLWSGIEIHSVKSGRMSWWGQHFAKGTVSMGLVGFVKSFMLNPLNWLNLRYNTVWGGGSGRTARTGRDRTADISWLAVIIGIGTAFVFFYKWMETIVARILTKIGNNVVDTQLPNDDDDLKPPAGWKFQPTAEAGTEEHGDKDHAAGSSSSSIFAPSHPASPRTEAETASSAAGSLGTFETPSDEVSDPTYGTSWTDTNTEYAQERNSIREARRQGWSFENT